MAGKVGSCSQMVDWRGSQPHAMGPAGLFAVAIALAACVFSGRGRRFKAPGRPMSWIVPTIRRVPDLVGPKRCTSDQL